MQSGRLDSWKAIAAYLGYSQRTVMRWHAERNLPIHRVPGGQRGSIFAFATELDAWISSRSGVQGNLAPVLIHRGTPSPSYERAQQLWEMRAESNLNEIIDAYRDAIQQDCNHSGAHAGLACALLSSSALDLIEGSIALLQARTAVTKALSLDSRCPDAICANGWIAFWNFDLAGAARCFRELTELKPNHSFGLAGNAWLATIRGERDRAFAIVESLLRQTAYSSYSALVASRIFLLNGESRKALYIAAQAIASRNAGPMIHVVEGMAFQQIGETEKAIRSLRQQVASRPENAALTGTLAYLYGIAGRYELAQRTCRQLENMSEHQVPGCSYPLAMAAVGLGKTQQALDWLERSCREKSFHSHTLRIDPAFQGLRGNAAFERMLERFQHPSSIPIAQSLS